VSLPGPALITIVIVNWNTASLLRACLESIRSQNAIVHSDAVEVVVVDNASTDESVSMIMAEFPEVKLIRNIRNEGFARGTNQGAQASRGTYLMFLNPDVVLFPACLSYLVEFMDEHPEAGMAGPKLVGSDGSLQTSAYPELTLGREFWRLFHLDRFYPLAIYPLSRWETGAAHSVDVVQGACLILRRNAIQQVGLLDEEYFMYTEEVDLCRRLRRAGWGVYWVPEAKALHHGGQSTRLRRLEMFLQLYASKVHFFRKHHGRPYAAAYKLLLALAALPRLLVFPVYWWIGFGKFELDAHIPSHYLHLLFALPSM
jgi:GT2 family glycosyltransferase